MSTEPGSAVAQGAAPFPWPQDEVGRIEALRSYAILDVVDSQEFDRLTLLSSQLFGVPIAVISFVDADRQWFLSRTGLSVAETDRDVAFCAHAICQSDVLVVPDARDDVRFRQNPLVTGDPNICFYAAAPLITPEGHAIGTLCVIDMQPRTFSPVQRQLLSHLAVLVMTQLEARRNHHHGLPQRHREFRDFLRTGHREFFRARRFLRPISLLWLEIHPTGTHDSEVAVTIADLQASVQQRLVRELRNHDQIAQTATGALAVLLIEADALAVEATAERLRQLAQQTLRDAGSAMAVWGGVASLAAVDQSFEDVQRRAQVLATRARFTGSTALCFINESDLSSHHSPGSDWLLDGLADLMLRLEPGDGSTSLLKNFPPLQRQAFFAGAQLEWERAMRFGRPLALLLLNLDHLARFNACWGRGSGDALLEAVRSILQRDLRGQDQLGLLGDGRFGVLMPETTGSAALVIAERIRGLVASHRFHSSQGGVHFMTVSGGISCIDPNESRFSSFFDRAEEALLAAKESGRNRICCMARATSSHVTRDHGPVYVQSLQRY